jgi:hypothetical protein
VGTRQKDCKRSKESTKGMVMTTETKSRDRFDLEQEILECWKVTNDINMFIEQGSSVEDFKTLAAYYEKKFDRLWSTFENMVHERKM